jgi:16S rRNA (adenine(1408)-N(1))-methyltransferase
VIVVEGKRTREMTRHELDDRMKHTPHRRIVVDVGTGDGRFAYATAAARPDWFVVGIDAISERQAELSTKAARKPARGGLANVLFVRATAEAPPAELHHRADDVHVVLPWGALLVGTMLAEPETLNGLTTLAKPGATLTVVFNAEVWEDSTPKDMADLPPVTVEYVDTVLRPAYKVFGVDLEPSRLLTPEEVDTLPTTWARKLAASHGGHPRFVLARGTVRAPAGLR